MILTKSGRPTQITDEQFRRVIEWKSLKAVTKEIGLSRKLAHSIRLRKYKQVSR